MVKNTIQNNSFVSLKAKCDPHYDCMMVYDGGFQALLRKERWGLWLLYLYVEHLTVTSESLRRLWWQ